MTKRFRLPCAMHLYQGNGRPPKPNWMLNPTYATRNQKRSWEYWSHIWQCTPQWINQKHVKAMKIIYNTAPDDHHVDHIVPLKSTIVCGLHVPWNLQHLPIAENYHKSNTTWPGCPVVQGDLFD